MALKNKSQIIPITRGYYENTKTLPDGATAVYWAESGREDGKIQKSVETAVVGKNIGKSNETTTLTQAILNIRSMYNEKIRKGGATDKDNLQDPTKTYTIEDLIKRKKWRVYPMALHDVNHETKTSSNWKHITYPGWIQPKYDGTRFLVIYHPSIGVDSYSRGLESYTGQEHIIEEMKTILHANPGLYFDGELWKSGYGLQHISGSSRRIVKGESAIKLDYYVFDCFDVSQKLTWPERLEKLRSIFANTNFTYVKLAPAYSYETKEDAVKLYEKFLSEHYEGGVLRNTESLYEFGVAKENRSYQTMKIKPFPDEDWPVVGFSQGIKGKDIGALKWVLDVDDETLARINAKYQLKAKLKDDNTFDVVPKGMSYKERYKAYEFLSAKPAYFDKYLKNKLMRVQYSIISDFGKPQQPKALGFRDLSLNEKFNNDVSDS